MTRALRASRDSLERGPNSTVDDGREGSLSERAGLASMSSAAPVSSAKRCRIVDIFRLVVSAATGSDSLSAKESSVMSPRLRVAVFVSASESTMAECSGPIMEFTELD